LLRFVARYFVVVIFRLSFWCFLLDLGRGDCSKQREEIFKYAPKDVICHTFFQFPFPFDAFWAGDMTRTPTQPFWKSSND